MKRTVANITRHLMQANRDLSRAEQAIAKMAAAYPETVEHGPWGHRAFKVRAKVFLFMATEGGVLSFSVKLPQSGAVALRRPGAAPTHYGLGKSGWVTFTFGAGDKVPLEDVKAWLRESFAAIAPKKLLATLDEPGEAVSAARAKKAPAKKAPAKKAPTKKAQKTRKTR